MTTDGKPGTQSQAASGTLRTRLVGHEEGFLWECPPQTVPRLGPTEDTEIRMEAWAWGGGTDFQSFPPFPPPLLPPPLLLSPLLPPPFLPLPPQLIHLN